MSKLQSTEQILELLTEGKFDQIISVCRGAEINDPQILEYYAIAQCHQGNLEESKAIFIKAIQKDQNNTNLLYNYTEILSDLGSHTAAKEILEKILTLDPTHSEAKAKYEKLKSINEDTTIDTLDTESSQVIESIERSTDPLKAAFNANEVSESKKNLIERARKTRRQKIHQRPSLPVLEREVLADERLLAAEDALREGLPEISLNLATEAAKMNANRGRVYALAGDAYLKLRKYNFAHLNYLIAQQYGELDLQRQINLLSLANTIGDSTLLEARKNELIANLGKTSLMQETINSIVGQAKANQNVHYDPEKGPMPFTSK